MKLYDLGFFILLGLFAYTVYTAERSEVDGEVTKDAFVEVVKSDWDARKPLDYSKLND